MDLTLVYLSVKANLLHAFGVSSGAGRGDHVAACTELPSSQRFAAHFCICHVMLHHVAKLGTAVAVSLLVAVGLCLVDALYVLSGCLTPDVEHTIA